MDTRMCALLRLLKNYNLYGEFLQFSRTNYYRLNDDNESVYDERMYNIINSFKFFRVRTKAEQRFFNELDKAWNKLLEDNNLPYFRDYDFLCRHNPIYMTLVNNKEIKKYARILNNK